MKRKLFCTAAMTALMVAGMAAAQVADQFSAQTPAAGLTLLTADQDDDTDIVATGFRASPGRAMAIKRVSDSVSDGAAVGTLGRYPDVKIAGSLQRVTGVPIIRSGRTGGTTGVRRLSPSIVPTALNGHLLRGGPGRTFDFLTLSPAPLSAATRKPSTSDINDGSPSGIVGAGSDRKR